MPLLRLRLPPRRWRKETKPILWMFMLCGYIIKFRLKDRLTIHLVFGCDWIELIEWEMRNSRARNMSDATNQLNRIAVWRRNNPLHDINDDVLRLRDSPHVFSLNKAGHCRPRRVARTKEHGPIVLDPELDGNFVSALRVEHRIILIFLSP